LAAEEKGGYEGEEHCRVGVQEKWGEHV
jgi:hypothetical protein